MGDNRSLDQLVLDHLPAALRFATRLTGEADRGEDLVQEALTRVAGHWTSFRGEASFRTWLFRIIINVFRDQLARPGLAIAPLDDADTVPSREESPADAAAAGELGEIIVREIARLPPRQREVLVLVAYEGLSIREVARVLQTNDQNVYATLSVARARLKSRLGPYVNEARREP